MSEKNVFFCVHVDIFLMFLSNYFGLANNLASAVNILNCHVLKMGKRHNSTSNFYAPCL